MPNYRLLYFTLFNTLTSAIEYINKANYDDARDLLVHAQQLTEEIHIETDEDISKD